MEIFRKYPALKWLLLWGGIIVLVVIAIHFFAKSGTSSTSTSGTTTDPNALGTNTEYGVAPVASVNQTTVVSGPSDASGGSSGGSGSPGGSGGSGGPPPPNPPAKKPFFPPVRNPDSGFIQGSPVLSGPYPAHGGTGGTNFAYQAGATARQAASRPPSPRPIVTAGHDARQAVVAHPQPVRKLPAFLSRLPQRRQAGTQRSLNRLGA